MARVALVLGAGGAVGHAFHAGVLQALHEATGWDARQAELVVGTSAGSVVGAMLRAGVGPGDLYARNLGEPLSRQAAELFAGAAWPRLGPADARGPASWAPLGNPGQVLAHALWPGGRTSPGAVLAAALPAGRIPTSAAVAASCAIPAYYEPVEVDGELHVDGGAHSPSNADVLGARPAAEPGPFDLVVVSAPMSGALVGAPRLGLQAQMRALFSAALRRELLSLGRLGATALVFEPVAEVVRAMGPDPLDIARRAGVARAARAAALERLGRPSLASRLELLRT